MTDRHGAGERMFHQPDHLIRPGTGFSVIQDQHLFPAEGYRFPEDAGEWTGFPARDRREPEGKLQPVPADRGDIIPEIDQGLLHLRGVEIIHPGRV